MAGAYRKAKITPSVVQKLNPGETVGDTDLDGFFVRRQKDARVYFVRKYARGQRHFVNIGKHGGEYTPTKARDEAWHIISALKKGLDPAVERMRVRQMPTIAEYGKIFLDENLPDAKPATLANYEGIFRNYVEPKLGRWKLDQLKDTDISALHRKLRATPRAANHVIDFIGSLYKQARTGKLVAKDFKPTLGFKRFKIERRERYLSTEELVSLGEALSSAAQNKTESPYVIAALRLLLLTGCRRNEILTLKWKDVDFERALLLLPDSKTGQKAIHLSPPALEVLTNIPRVEKNPFVIVGEREGKHLVNLQKAWRRLRSKAGLDDVRIHDLRHSYASLAAASGASLPMIGKLLGHTQAQTTARYAHLAANPLKQVNDEVGKKITGAMSGNEAEVSDLKRSAANG